MGETASGTGGPPTPPAPLIVRLAGDNSWSWVQRLPTPAASARWFEDDGGVPTISLAAVNGHDVWVGFRFTGELWPLVEPGLVFGSGVVLLND